MPGLTVDVPSCNGRCHAQETACRSTLPCYAVWNTHLEVETQAGALLGGARIRLLEQSRKFGSISKAAQRIPVSYKAAWDALDDLNNLADFPVIERNIGGGGGG